MPSATQLPLFSSSTTDRAAPARCDAASERLLAAFGHARLAAGAHRRSVAREVSQLRALARDAGRPGDSVPLAAMVSDPAMVARLLLEPPQPIARSTGRARLVAVQRFVRVVAPALGMDAATEIARLDALLPAWRQSGWHDAGTVVAGEVGRRRLGPTLDASDLERIVEAAGMAATGQRALRDRALVALACFSGLRAEEIVQLRWEEVSRELTGAGYYGLAVRVERRGRCLHLLVPAPASDALAAWAAARWPQATSGPVFPARGRAGRPLGYRTARAALSNACRRAGLPPAEAVELRAACAWWLKAQGLSDHEVAEVLGLARVRSVDRLLRRHAELQAQRIARERLDRPK
jgi:integrase